MPRFSLKDLFWCVTLIGLGVAGWWYTLRLWGEWVSGEAMVAMLCGWTLLIGAGIGALWRHKAVGAVLFFMVAFALALISLVLWPPVP
jgi:hypothetical protein